jgi:hypothetical protein
MRVPGYPRPSTPARSRLGTSKLHVRLSAVGVRRAVLVTVFIVVVIASSAATLVLLTDVALFLALAVWIAPVVVLIPYAHPSVERRHYGVGTVAAALILPAVTAIWVLWLVIIHSH